MSATISISTAIELQFDKLYTELTFENIQVTRTLRLLLEDLEVSCITEATSNYTTEAEQQYDEGRIVGEEDGYELGYSEKCRDRYEEGFGDGYDQAIEDMQKED